jgi:isoleucyl-tRNA synthetase
VALDITISENLRQEGTAREFINRLQNYRKEKGFDVTDRIIVKVETDDATIHALDQFKQYICSEILADSLEHTKDIQNGIQIEIEGITSKIEIVKNG